MIQVHSQAKPIAARVALVDQSLQTILDVYVSHEAENIRDCHTRWSGVRPENLLGEETWSFSVVRDAVRSVARGRTLVGHAIHNDLRALGLHARDLHESTSIADTCALDWGDRDVGLQALAEEVLGITIQQGEHDPVEDALSTMRLFLMSFDGPPPMGTFTVTVQCSSQAAAVDEAFAPHTITSWQDEQTCTVEVERSRASLRRLLEGLLGNSSSLNAPAESITFPPSLTRRQRSLVHGIAEKLGLETLSTGVGSARHVKVVSKAMSRSVRDIKRRREKAGDKATVKLAANLYRWAREDEGQSATLSRGEIAELVEECSAHGRLLPDCLQRLCEEHLCPLPWELADAPASA